MDRKKTEGVRMLWEKYKFVALIVLIGVVLLLISLTVTIRFGRFYNPFV